MRIPDNLKWKATGKTLGQGGQGTVVEVIEKNGNDEPKYALKGLAKNRPQKAYQRFIKEISAIKQINHPSIIKIIDHSELDVDFHYYVMELVPNAVSFKKLLNSEQSPYYSDPLRSLKFFMQIVEVVKACEEFNIVHRDLSPSNVLILPDGTIKIIDFGLCQIEGSQSLTLVDEGVGTQYYMSPECESGAEGEISSTSDLYSAGKLLWSAVANLSAFSRESPVFNSKSMQSLFPHQPNIWHLHHVFEKTVRRDPKNRWENAEVALNTSKKIHFLIASGYPPLELVKENCPLCGFGTFERFQSSHMVFGNPNPSGIAALQCNHCGYCFAINFDRINQSLKKRKELE